MDFPAPRIGFRPGYLLLIVFFLYSVIQSKAAEPNARSSNAPGGHRKKYRISDPQLADEVLARGGQLVADYGSFQFVQVDEALALELSARLGAEDFSQDNRIELNAGPLDTATPEVKALRKVAVQDNKKRLHLVHFAGPVKLEWRVALEQNGVKVIDYIPHNAYLIYGTGTDLAKMQTWAGTTDYVQWEGEYADKYKIHPRARTVDDKGNAQKPSTDLFAIQLVADDSANALTLQVVDRLKIEPIQKQSQVLNYLNILVRLPPERLGEIAAQPEVISIHPYVERRKLDERQDQIMAANLAGNGPSGPGYLAWLASKGFTQAQFTGSALVVDVTDSGIDNGTTLPGHFGLYGSGTTNQGSRVVYNRLQGTPNAGSTLQGCDGHGTLNTHIIASFADLAAGFPHTDTAGYQYDLGVCPFVKVGSSVIFDPDKFTNPNYANLQSQAYNDGARISNNSWGGDTAGDYDVDAQEYDALVRDAQPSGSSFSTAGNQPMVILFASGNAGIGGAQTVGSPGTAKNVITVGAGENVRSHGTSSGGNDALGNDGCSTPDSDADNANDIADFSSRGPCSDGRQKPDVVGPGTHVTGGVAQNSPPPPSSGTGSAIPCFKASGVCALPGGGTTNNPDNFFPLGQQFYTTSTGTSHSTPAAAGACALIRQYFINHGLAAPSPAMTKAFLMNSARYMTGLYANDSLWSPNQGMGEVNLGTAFDGSARSLHDQVFAEKFTATGQTRAFTGSIIDPSKPFRVTLAWTDAPGSTTGNAFNNNLDLTVTVGGNVYKGNVFSGQFSTPGGVVDTRNNVESVFLPAGLSGTFSVVVTAANINSDGVPNEAPALDQDFALVVYNGSETVGPVITVDSVAVIAESCSPTNGAVDPGETVTVDFALKNVGTISTTNLVVSLVATGGVSGVSGPQAYGAVIAGGAAVSKPFSFTANGSCGDSINCILELSDSTHLGAVSLAIPLGQTAGLYAQNFDAVTVPNLPGGWTSSGSGGQVAWVTSSSQRDTVPNAAFSANSSTAGANALVSPVMAVSSSSAQLSFRHYYNMESQSSGGTAYDGGVLEIKIGGGSFTDILSAGGSFAAGGYTHTLTASTGNPLGGRQAWSGDSGGFVTTTVTLPPSAIGQNIQLRWRCATDSDTALAGWYIDTISLSGRMCCGSIFTAPPLIQAGTASLVSEACSPPNSAPDPGEVVTYNFGLQNIGAGAATNLVATLLATNGVGSPSGAKNYGSIASGATVSQPFTFTASGSCGDIIAPSFQLQNGTQNLGVVSVALQLGQFLTTFSENFDSVGVPALPAGWITLTSGAQSTWVSSGELSDSSPNSMFSTDASSVGVNELDTPAIMLPANPVQLSFRHNYDLEASSSGTTAYDGGVLEIKIGAGSFTDIVTAGGSFVAGGYSHSLSSSYSNPLAGRRCWSGTSGGFITTTVLLPAGASGQTIQLRWRCASDASASGDGWYVDTVLLSTRICCGEISAPIAAFSGSPASGGYPLTVNFTDISSGTITNRFWDFGNGATTNTLLASLSTTYDTASTNTVSLTVSGPLGTNKLTRTNYIVVTNAIPILISNSLTLALEGCTNGMVDSGERVTMNFGLVNAGTASATNLVATLLAGGGISSPSGAQSYGNLPPGGLAVKPFSFLTTGNCGTTNFATLQLQDGPVGRGSVTFAIVLGQPGLVFFAQNFDAVTAPALPAGWTSLASGAGMNWGTTNAQFDTAPNSVFSASVNSAGVGELDSPVIALPPGPVQLAFHHFYNMESGYDGGVVDIKIGGGSFTNLANAGGVFLTNGPNTTLSSSSGNPLAGQIAWSGSPGIWITTIVNLPPAASGQNVQLRWRVGSDTSFAYTGWYVDSISLSGYQCCANGPWVATPPHDLTVMPGGTATFSVVAAGTAPFTYQWQFYGTNLNGANESSYSRTNAQLPDAGPYQVVITNPVSAITSSPAVLTLVGRPMLVSPQKSNGTFRFTLSGNTGYNYAIESSTNLVHWSAVITVTNMTGQTPVVDPTASNVLYRFYRARLVP